METELYHIPVLLSASVEGLKIRQDGTYVDVTLGGGGHSRHILQQLGPEGRLLSFDQDADAIARCARERDDVALGERWTLIRSNFRYLKNWMRYYGIEAIDGLLADLGVSSHHFDDGSRGFSFRSDAPLDMRMNQQGGLTAADVLQTYGVEQLTSLFRLYGELRQARRLAETVVKTRERQTITTTGQLSELFRPILGREHEKKDLARAFQALRIEVNHEMDALRAMLQSATEMLRPGGRLVVISYHSLEDRLVKNVMKSGSVDGTATQDAIFGHALSPLRPVGKPITPAADELESNPRSRSAKLRVAERLDV
ncbi:MAG: 16S rRNA (cytosine(1402)-N(4))-methyltransferase RsmH [Bacteroidaceae bacterium]|nr:16S rRNA (cytosine(1402)-N(4))-methyltransferase RsmH [Bacteroidaceae bacterium]